MTTEYPSINTIKSWLPPDVFVISPAKSIAYALFDVGMFLLCSLLIMNTSGYFVIPLQLISGFFMWSIFVVGHDCGHGTFSRSKLLNHICGELFHSVILCTPFYPWKLSHHQHHLYHNHVDKDYSHMWILPDELESSWSLVPFYRTRILGPLYSWFVYLYIGLNDGTHFLLQFGRLWKSRSMSDRILSVFSSLISLGTMYAWYTLGIPIMVKTYVVPWFIYAWWLFTVTYLQHHYPNQRVYGDGSWTFVKGAFQTVDRSFGSLVDELTHHITDGHIVHHIFFTKIPHYNLKRATEALRKGLKENGYDKLYLFRDTSNFYTYIWTYFYKYWFILKPEQIE